MTLAEIILNEVQKSGLTTIYRLASAIGKNRRNVAAVVNKLIASGALQRIDKQPRDWVTRGPTPAFWIKVK